MIDPLNSLEAAAVPVTTPERLLFFAVVGMTIVDATAKRPSENRDKARAVAFSSVGVTAEHFEYLCLCAGLDPDFVRDHIQERIEEEKPLTRYALFRALNLGHEEP